MKRKLTDCFGVEHDGLRPAILDKNQEAASGSRKFHRASGELRSQVTQLNRSPDFQSEGDERFRTQAMALGALQVGARIWMCRVHVRRVCLKTSLIRTATVACNLILSQRESELSCTVGNQL